MKYRIDCSGHLLEKDYVLTKDESGASHTTKQDGEDGFINVVVSTFAICKGKNVKDDWGMNAPKFLWLSNHTGDAAKFMGVYNLSSDESTISRYGGPPVYVKAWAYSTVGVTWHVLFLKSLSGDYEWQIVAADCRLRCRLHRIPWSSAQREVPH